MQGTQVNGKASTPLANPRTSIQGRNSYQHSVERKQKKDGGGAKRSHRFLEKPSSGNQTTSTTGGPLPGDIERSTVNHEKVKRESTLQISQAYKGVKAKKKTGVQGVTL